MRLQDKDRRRVGIHRLLRDPLFRCGEACCRTRSPKTCKERRRYWLLFPWPGSVCSLQEELLLIRQYDKKPFDKRSCQGHTYLRGPGMSGSTSVSAYRRNRLNVQPGIGRWAVRHNRSKRDTRRDWRDLVTHSPIQMHSFASAQPKERSLLPRDPRRRSEGPQKS